MHGDRLTYWLLSLSVVSGLGGVAIRDDGPQHYGFLLALLVVVDETDLLDQAHYAVVVAAFREAVLDEEFG
jgi:hypothetical protein